MEKAKFQQTFDKWAELNRELYKDCKEYLVDVLNKLPNKECIICDEAMVCVTYNGGRHPEYDSNCFSNVCRVYLKENNEIYLDIEETDEYSIDNINASYLYDVADAVEVSIAKDYEIED